MRRILTRWTDVISDALSAANARPSRTLLAGLGGVLGVTVFLTTRGIASTAAAQVSDTFTELVATEVRLVDQAVEAAAPTERSEPIDVARIERQLERLAGLRAAGARWSLETEPPMEMGTDPTTTSPNEDLRLLAVTPGYFRAVRAKMTVGRPFDVGHDARGQRVAVLGSIAARRLGARSLDPLPLIWIAGRAHLVAGIVGDVERDPDVLGAVMIPSGTATRDYSLPQNAFSILLDVSPGAAKQVARLAPLAVRPQDPRRFRVSYPPEPKKLQGAVESDLDSLLFGLSGVALAIGAVGIANTNLVSVSERTTEIGLRRAIGASKGRIAGQFLAESIVIGIGSGVVAAALSPAVILVVAALQGWSPVLETQLLIIGPLTGGFIGALSGSWPASRAARIEPAVALRR